ncbi:MAG TPA: TonB-dependent receptor plug domain-containing protein [Flavitalea sp.]|nr:TonB-dependent receptor plug domain-containing protein [Flavitalea sp.]
MRTIKWCIVIFLFTISFVATAQQTARVKGSVLTESGEVLDGVSVIVIDPGSKKAQTTTTNEKGIFAINNLIANKKYDFSFSYVGYETSHVNGFLVNAGENNSLMGRMKSADVKMNDEVVVTALGIRREEKSLGYSAQSVKENAVKDAKSNNWVNTLSGKVAGLNIQGTGSGPMSSSRITLRGESSLNLDNNQALIIIDGVPVSSKITGTNSPGNVGVDFGSSVSDINPDDIEKISVLKGPGATALYGSRAAGGALIITTKSGQRKGKGIGVTLNSNISFDRVNRWPDYQYEYGEGRTQEYYSYGDSPDGTNTSTGVAAGRA